MTAPIRLHPDDIEAIAAAVVRQQKLQEETSLDLEYLATLPIEDRQKIHRKNNTRNRAARRNK